MSLQRLYLFGDVTHELCGALVARLDAANDESLITICSGGGESDAAHALIAAIQRSPYGVHTYATGDASSAALDILYSGTTRGAHPHTIFMSHGSSSNQGPRYMDILRDIEKRLYASSPYILANWSALFGRRKRYWTSAQMQEFGFVDYVAEVPLTVC